MSTAWKKQQQLGIDKELQTCNSGDICTRDCSFGDICSWSDCTILATFHLQPFRLFWWHLHTIRLHYFGDISLDWTILVKFAANQTALYIAGCQSMVTWIWPCQCYWQAMIGCHRLPDHWLVEIGPKALLSQTGVCSLTYFRKPDTAATAICTAGGKQINQDYIWRADETRGRP